MANVTAPRSVVKKYFANPDKREDANILRTIPRESLIDPFVALLEFSVTPPAPGFSDHPHRGFEAATFMVKGSFKQFHNNCHRATLNEGDVQWTTMGKGFIHNELPAGPGENRGLQFWINLPSKDRMIETNFKEIPSKEVKKAERDGVEVRVIAGEALGVKSPSYTKIPTWFLDFTLKPNTNISQSIPKNLNAFVYVYDGEGVFGQKDSVAVPAFNVLVLGPGDGLNAWNKSSKPLRFAIAAGQPLNEQSVMKGPFVTNTQADLDKTIDDYKNHRVPYQPAKC